jgi:hypothetical protein
MSQRLPRRVGMAKAQEMTYTARTFSGREAEAMGLVNWCVPDAGFDAALAATARSILANSWTAARQQAPVPRPKARRRAPACRTEPPQEPRRHGRAHRRLHEQDQQAGLSGACCRPTHRRVVAVFAVVYLGMFLGGLPRLKLDRSGVALLGAIAVIALGGQTLASAAQAVDLPTLVLLFAFMVLSAQLRMSGFYAAVAQRVGAMPLSRPALLGALIAVAAGLSAVFSNDVVCLAMTPVVARLCLQRGLPPVPFLLGLACAANIGSAATLIGNPQNMLIGSVLQLSFPAYLRQALPPVLASLVLLWAWLAWGPGARAAAGVPRPGLATADPPLDAWQTAKGLAVAAALMGVFLLTTGRATWPPWSAPACCCSAAGCTRPR